MRLERLTWVLFALYLTFLGGASYYNTLFAVRIFHHIFMSLVLGAWVWRCARAGGLPAIPINNALIALALYWGINAFFARDARMAFEHVWFGVIHLLLFWLVVERFQRGRQRLLMETVFMMASLVLFITLLEFGTWYFGWGILPNTSVGWLEATGQIVPPLNALPRASLAMTISTLLGGYVAPLTVLCVVWASTVARRDYRIVLWLMAGLLACVVLLTRSRGAMLSLGVGLGSFALYHLFFYMRVRSQQLANALLGGGVVIGMITVGAFVWLTLPQGDTGVSNAGRRDMWQSAVAITADNPILGVGYGMFGRVFRDYRNPEIAQDQLASAHNLYLNTLSETGILGAALLAFLFYQAGRLAWQRWRAMRPSGNRTRFIGVLAGLLGVAVHSMVDVFSITPIVFLLLIMVGYVLVDHPSTRLARPARSHRALAWAGVGVVGVYALAFFVWDSAQGHFMASLRSNNAQEALAETRQARALDPHMRLYPLHEAFIIALTSPPSAGDALIEALSLEPTWDTGWLYLADWHEQRGETEQALLAMTQAITIQARTPLQVHWARLAEQVGVAEAETIQVAYLRGISEAYRTTQDLPTAPFWRETPLRQQAMREWLINQPYDMQYRVWQAHDTAEAERLISDAPQTAEGWWIVGMHALETGDNARAIQAFDRAITLAPMRGDYYASRARAQHASNPTQALQDLARARVFGTILEMPDAILALWEGKPYQPPQRAIRQEFAGVLFSRPAVFAPPLRYDYPR